MENRDETEGDVLDNVQKDGLLEKFVLFYHSLPNPITSFYVFYLIC